MGIPEFLLKLVTEEGLYDRFARSDEDEQQELLREYGLSEEDQRLLSERDLSKLRLKLTAEFGLGNDEEAAIWTIYSMPGTIYIPPPPPPTEQS